MNRHAEVPLAPHDAVLMVHPDCLLLLQNAQRAEWFKILRSVQVRATRANKPLMLSPMTSDLNFGDIVAEAGLEPGFITVDSRDIVAEVSAMLGKHCSEVSVLLGGLMAHGCVRNWAANVCANIRTGPGDSDPSEWMMQNQWWKKPEQFGSGQIDYSLTNLALSNT